MKENKLAAQERWAGVEVESQGNLATERNLPHRPKVYYLSYFSLYFCSIHIIHICDDTGDKCANLTDCSHVAMQHMAMRGLRHIKLFLSLWQEIENTSMGLTAKWKNHKSTSSWWALLRCSMNLVWWNFPVVLFSTHLYVRTGMDQLYSQRLEE